MIPSETIKVLGSSQPSLPFKLDSNYVVGGNVMLHVETLMRRLYTEQRMGGDEMRDWGNVLHTLLNTQVWEGNDHGL